MTPSFANLEAKNIRTIVCDIEGTTTAIDFVHKTLFPYARERLARFVDENLTNPEVMSVCSAVRQLCHQGSWGVQEVITQLLAWSDADAKIAPLKTLQGMIWEEGYRAGLFVTHVYEDVAPCLRQWQAMGIGLAIYSSGSVQAQKLLFAHTSAGDLTKFFTRYFDTGVGAKREKNAYLSIATALQQPPHELLFLSDVMAECQAALDAGWQSVLVCRDALPPSEPLHYPWVSHFNAVRLKVPC